MGNALQLIFDDDYDELFEGFPDEKSCFTSFRSSGQGNNVESCSGMFEFHNSKVK